MEPKIIHGLLILLLTSVFVSGCLNLETDADPESSDDQPLEDPGGSNESMEPWNVSIEAQPFMVAAFGQPFQRFSSSGGECTFFEFRVPSNTTSLEVVLEGSASSPGAGYLTFMLRRDGLSWMYPGPTLSEPPIYQVPPSERTVMAEDDPAPGIWQVWVWPHGVVADQTWDLTIAMEGIGTEPNLDALGTDDFFC